MTLEHIEREILIPKKIPFPIGQAEVKYSEQYHQFRGGFVPEDRYPLVSEPPLQGRGQLQFSPAQWNRIIQAMEPPPHVPPLEEQWKSAWTKKPHPVLSEKELLEAQRLMRLKEEAAKAEEARDEAEMAKIRAEKKQQQWEQIQRAKEMLRRQDERHTQIHQALLQSEVIAVNEKNIIDKERKSWMENTRQKQLEHTVRDHFDKYEGILKERERAKIEEYKRLQDLQRQQMMEHEEEERKREDESRLERQQLEFAAKSQEVEDHFKSKLGQNDRKAFHQSQQEITKIHQERLKEAKELEARELAQAKAIQESLYKRKEHFEKMMKKRVVDIGKKQFKAKQSYAKEVIPKGEESLKKEKEKIERQLFENEKRLREEEAKAEQIKNNHLDELKEFREKDQMVKENLCNQAEKEKLDFFEKQQRDFAEHLKRTESSLNRIQNKKIQLVNFWDNQSAELVQRRKDWTQLKEDCATEKTQKELDLERSFFQDLDQVQMEQLQRGRNVIPLKKVHQNMTLYRDPVIEALDSSGIRLRNNFHGKNLLEKYSPQKARERLSLNWND